MKADWLNFKPDGGETDFWQVVGVAAVASGMQLERTEPLLLTGEHLASIMGSCGEFLCAV